MTIKRPNEFMRDDATPGMPLLGAHEPPKPDIRAYLNAIVEGGAKRKLSTTPVQLLAADVGYRIYGDLSVLGVVAATLPDPASISDGDLLWFCKLINRAEGRFEVHAYAGSTVCHQSQIDLPFDGQFCLLQWDLADTNWNMLDGGCFTAFRGGRYLQEHDFSTPCTLAQPTVQPILWSEVNGRLAQFDTAAGNILKELPSKTAAVLQTKNGAIFSPLSATFQKRGSDFNTAAFYAYSGESIDAVAAPYAGIILDKPFQVREIGVVSNGAEITNSYDPHDSDICNARLSVHATDPHPASAIVASATIYLHPFQGDRIALPTTTGDGVSRFWQMRHINSVIARTLSDSTYGTVPTGAGLYNVYAQSWSDTSIALILGVKDAGFAELVKFGGMYVNAVGLAPNVQAKSGRYIGTLYVTAGGFVDWAGRGLIAMANLPATLGVWNYANRLPTELYWAPTGGDYTYATATWRAARGNANAYVSLVQGINDRQVEAFYRAAMSSSGTGVNGRNAVALDGTTPDSNSCALGYSNATTVGIIEARFCEFAGIGAHTLQPVEYASAATITFSDLALGAQKFLLRAWM